MNDPQRLLSGDADERERALLSAADAEEPSAHALSRLQQTLGLTVDPAPLLAPRMAAPAPRGSLEAAGGGGQASSLLASKWILLSGASAALVGALVWSQVATPHAAERAVGAPAVATSGPAPVSGASATSAPAGTAEARQAGSSIDDAPALRDELTRLERARTALHDRRARVALSTLDDYDRAYPRGALREEAEALRIETLLALDEVARARELGAAFVRSYPHSVHGARVSSQLEQRGAR